ncbi:hypothetical protein IE077_004237 [Cardiosporidium cionae]|uniref:Uncharacterized protein n=1 Tax=Cardiosporidium cionae TaxID=476202 RepID=A0ABQ7JDJ7_9APIC|nr:hypothetical protein IE077_004237 [Cardiosporidium cionae]|eukprot:KAF8821985.1 hypothetical protein IE077_004237 [Cardiosporidium cionae]
MQTMKNKLQIIELLLIVNATVWNGLDMATSLLEESGRSSQRSVSPAVQSVEEFMLTESPGSNRSDAHLW